MCDVLVCSDLTICRPWPDNSSESLRQCCWMVLKNGQKCDHTLCRTMVWRPWDFQLQHPFMTAPVSGLAFGAVAIDKTSWEKVVTIQERWRQHLIVLASWSTRRKRLPIKKWLHICSDASYLQLCNLVDKLASRYSFKKAFTICRVGESHVALMIIRACSRVLLHGTLRYKQTIKSTCLGLRTITKT